MLFTCKNVYKNTKKCATSHREQQKADEGTLVVVVFVKDEPP